MAYRSNFPSEIDSFLEHYEIQAYDVPKVARFQELKLQANRTPAEDIELTNLTTELRDKIISAEDFNKFQDALVQMQVFIRDNVAGYINTMKSDVQTFVNNAKTDMTNTKNSYSDYVDQQESDIQNFANQKKTEIQNLLDQTTAGQLNNRIEGITGERVESFIEADVTTGNPLYMYGVEEEFDNMVILSNVNTLAERDAIVNPVDNSYVYVVNDKQVYKRSSGKWNAVPKRKQAVYTWVDADNPKTIEDRYFKSPVSKNTTTIAGSATNVVYVGNNILDTDFVSGGTYLEIGGVRYKVNSITKIFDSGNNHVSTNVTLNTSLVTASGTSATLITCNIDSIVTTEFIYNGVILRAIKRKKV